MANKFLVVSLPKDEIARQSVGWIRQLIDKVLAYGLLNEASTFRAVARVTKPREDSWAIDTCYGHISHSRDFMVKKSNFKAFRLKGSLIFISEVPDAVILIAEEDKEEFLTLCAKMDIQAAAAVILPH